MPPSTAHAPPSPAADWRRAFWRGLVLCLPFVLVIAPFGMLFGVVAVEAGLEMAGVMGFSLAVFAGASQFTAVQLIRDQAPVLVVIATTLAVNLRLAMYSAALTPQMGPLPVWQRAVVAFFLTDQNFAIVTAEHERRPNRPLGERFAFFVGTIIPLAPVWYVTSWIGAKVGAWIPPEYALDFAVPITFLALLAPLLRAMPQVAAALVSGGLALLLVDLPYSLGILVAAGAAMLAGALVEIWQEQQR